MEYEHVLIFAGGDFNRSKLTDEATASANYIIAADSGADRALAIGVYPHALVGDLDSISSDALRRLKERGIEPTMMPTTLQSTPDGQTGPKDATEKDQTDFELAVKLAIKIGARRITAFGAISGPNHDHSVANMLYAVESKVPIQFIDGKTCILAKQGPSAIEISGHPDDIVSLQPIDPVVDNITTSGLKYSLTHEPLRRGETRGLRNRLLANKARVSFGHGILQVTHIIHE